MHAEHFTSYEFLGFWVYKNTITVTSQIDKHFSQPFDLIWSNSWKDSEQLLKQTQYREQTNFINIWL